MNAFEPLQSYTALTQQVVREAEGPIPVAEIMRRVHSLRPIESPSPSRLIRHAVSQSRLIANTGDGRYWWYPRLLKGSRVRVPLIASDLELGRIVFDHDARYLLWPSPFAASEQVDRNPIELRLGAGACVSLPFEHFGEGVWDLAPHLLATGCYRHPIPPDPISPFWRRIESQIEMLRVYADEFAGRRRRSGKKGRGKAKTKAPEIYQLKVTLYDIAPPIWRRLQVAGDTTLGDLHWILQLGMGWTHSHLHRFEIGDAQYSDPTFDLSEAPDEFGNEFRARLDRVVGGEGARFLHEYDFGDCWRHEIEVEKILPAAEGETYPKLVDGECACPPEDCGGFIGYANFLEEIGDENHPEHERSLEWVGGYFDPERFDVEGVNWELKKFAEIE